MQRGRVIRSVCFDKHEVGGVIELLDDVKPGYARFTDAVAGIFQTGFLEILNALRLNVNVNMNN
jgi:hypothetical protein